MKHSSSFPKLFFHRLFAPGIPTMPEIERFGADGEETIYRMLREHFPCVIRNPVVPHGNGYLEKDFLVLYDRIPFVIEVKNWKGSIGLEGSEFYQDKENGEHKVLKSPVGTTKQFISKMKQYYDYNGYVYGMVLFAQPDCKLDLPPEREGILLTSWRDAISVIRSVAREHGKETAGLIPERILHCVRLYDSDGQEFCKGVLTDMKIPCYTESGEPNLLNTLYLRYLSIDRLPFRLRDRMTVTFTNGSSAIFYNRDATLTLHTLDGNCRRVSLSKIRTVVF